MLFLIENMEQGRVVGERDLGALVPHSLLAGCKIKKMQKYSLSKYGHIGVKRMKLSLECSRKEHNFCVTGVFLCFQSGKEPRDYEHHMSPSATSTWP